ncbi:MAG: hypothetical protein KGH66_04090, partial [Candidatus Micrarchaeota archaeon]|nr:hypothetical protein [Candidatus Micrarchaeota archaeon]
TILLLVLFKVYKGDKMMLLLEAVLVVIGAYILFIILFGYFAGSSYSTLFGNALSPASIAAFVAAVALFAAKRKIPRLRNTTTMVASIGAGLLLGAIFNFWIALLFMAILAVYDFIAVFVTKHMVALADIAMRNNLSFMVTTDEIKAVPVGALSREQLVEYQKERPALVKQGGLSASLVKEGMVPVSARSGLGNGDLAVPLMVAVSAYKVHMDFTLSLVVATGGVLGLVITMAILKKYRRALPAIPPLMLGILIALGIYFGVTLL